jgi:hypothetical protein
MVCAARHLQQVQQQLQQLRQQQQQRHAPCHVLQLALLLVLVAPAQGAELLLQPLLLLVLLPQAAGV